MIKIFFKDKLHRKIVLISSAISLFSIAFFLFYNPEFEPREIKLVGVIKDLKNEVKKKAVDSVDWEKLQEFDEVRANDLIFTGSKSSATIELYNKDLKLNMLPNSILRIDVKEDTPRVDIEKGDSVFEYGKDVNFIIAKDKDVRIVKSKPDNNLKNSEKNVVSFNSVNLDSKERKKEIDKLVAAAEEEEKTSNGNEEFLRELEKRREEKKKEQAKFFYIIIGMGAVMLLLSFF